MEISIKKYFFISFFIFTLVHSASVISYPEKVIAKFMATLLGIGHVAPDSKSKLKIPEGDRKKMIEEGGIEKQEKVKKRLTDLYENLLKRKSDGHKVENIFRKLFEIARENNPHKVSTANEKQLFTSRLDQIARLIISLRSKEKRGEYTFIQGVDSQSLLDVCQLTGNYWARVKWQGLFESEHLNHKNLSIWWRSESWRQDHVNRFKQFVNSVKTSNEDKGNGYKKELISDQDIIKYMESIIQFNAQSWKDETPLDGIPEDDRPALEEDCCKRFCQERECIEKFWVDVIRNDKEKKLTHYLESYMSKSLKNNPEEEKYCLALDHEAILSTLAPLKDADPSTLDKDERQIVKNLLLSAEKVNEHYKHCKDLIQTNREIAQKSKNYEEFKVFAKNNTEGEIEALEKLFNADVSADKIELAALQLSEKGGQRPDFSANEQADCLPPENPCFHEVHPSAPPSAEVHPSAPPSAEVHLSAPPSAEVHPSAPPAPVFFDPFRVFGNPAFCTSGIQSITVINTDGTSRTCIYNAGQSAEPPPPYES
jgi:hypothetical protein